MASSSSSSSTKANADPVESNHHNNNNNNNNNNAVLAQLQSLLSPLMQDQIPLERLTLRDIVLWHHVFVSALIFITGNMLYLLLQVFELSIITLISHVILLQVVAFFIYHLVQRFVRGSASTVNDETSPDFSRFMLTQEQVQPYVSLAIKRFNAASRFYLSVLQCQNYSTTLLFCISALCFDLLGSVFSGLNLVFIAFWILFTVPVFYVWQQIRIDDILATIIINSRFGCKALCDRFPVLRNVMCECMLPTPQQRVSPRSSSASHQHRRKKHN